MNKVRLNIFYCIFIQWVGQQVLSALVTALPLQDNTKYQHGNTKIFRKYQNISFGKVRERERERDRERERGKGGESGEKERDPHCSLGPY